MYSGYKLMHSYTVIKIYDCDVCLCDLFTFGKIAKKNDINSNVNK